MRGDYFTMRDAQSDDVDLQFYYPERTNDYIDAMCVPTCAQNKELAEIFINYMLSEKSPPSPTPNTRSYASPNRLVFENAGYREDMGEDAIEILYPEMTNFAEQYNQMAVRIRNLDADTLDYLNTSLGVTSRTQLTKLLLQTKTGLLQIGRDFRFSFL